MNFFFKTSVSSPKVDIHSHLIPAIDDGSKAAQETVRMLKEFKHLGYEKVITTPHTHPSYPNTVETIAAGYQNLISEVGSEIEVQLEYGSEYYVDETLSSKIRSGEIISFGDGYVLVESSFMNKPMIFESVLFELKSKGYQPVLAHPERYQFLEGRLDWITELRSMNILMQVTIGSFSGYYGEEPKRIAMQMLKKGWIDFLGSDLHRVSQIEPLKAGLGLKKVQELVRSNRLLNNSLL